MITIEILSKFPHLSKINAELLGFLRNSGWLLFDRLTRLLLGVFISAWVARYLGPEQYGNLAYVLAFLAFFQVLVSLGLDGVVVREISRNPTCASATLGTAFILRVMAGVVALLMGTGLVYLLADFTSALLFALCGAGLVFQATDTVDLWFQSQSQSRRTVIAKLCAYAMSSGAKVACILSGAPLTYFAGIFSFEAMISAIALYVSYRKYPHINKWVINLSDVSRLLKDSWPVLMSGLAIIAYLKSDQLLIEYFMGVKYLGIYYSAVTLTSLFYFIPVLLNVSAAPYIHRLATDDNEKFEVLMGYYFSSIFIISILIVATLFIFAEPLILALYGPDYLEGATVVKIHSLAIIFIFMGSSQNNWLIAKNLASQMFYRSLMTLSIGFCLNLWLIPWGGLAGGAVSFVIASALGLFFSNFFINRKLFMAQLTCFSLKKYKARYDATDR